MQNKKYSKKDFDIDRLSANLKLSIDASEREGFLCDLCDMTNYVYDNLMSESVSDALAISAPLALSLLELREDIPHSYENVGEILALAPSTLDGHIAVPKTVESSEVGE